jgi:hypothetical protein
MGAGEIMSDQMTITFEAPVVNVKRLTSKAGKEFSVFTLKRQAVYKDVVTVEQYEVTAFGARANVARVGDIVNASVRVGSRLCKDRFWPLFTLISATKKGCVMEAATESHTQPNPDGVT